MFENLTARLDRAVRELRGSARITGELLDASLREVRMALLEADVALPVVRDFIARVREKALGTEVLASLTPGQAVVRIVRDELQFILGMDGALRLAGTPPAVILMAGLQGAGKTTTAAKLGRWLREQRKSVLLVSTDVYRPAAMEQLQRLCQENQLEYFPAATTEAPVAIAAAALQKARARFMDVLIIDTAGRLHMDAAMMDEARELHAMLNPSDTLFVVDSMMGQDAVRAAGAFTAALPLSGVILTKMDGDARGGAALSVRHATGVPILFLGSGEKTADLQPFQAERIVSRILGMGDMLSLIEEVERKTDRKQADELVQKLRRGKGFDLDDFRGQLQQMRNLGGLSGLMDKLPGGMQIPREMVQQVDERQLMRLDAIISSMTRAERRRPDLINGSRKRRIAGGSGTAIQDVNRLLKQFDQAQKMMKRLNKKGGMANMMRGLSSRMPKGFRP
ncbi:MAG: signal recognition particle protein [Gammaproteobacteria bacterium RIFCSPLOWO2_02_FULL_61_13]|nr:MAG: signal recognition particle protein [Gammaproteobacteria bacterium RIFCSPLOWO2_02_FULL_61_13]